MYADIIYGVYWRFNKDSEGDTEYLRTALGLESKPDLDQNELLDELVTKHPAATVVYHNDERTVWFGQLGIQINETTNDFDEMAIVRSLDLKSGTLREDLRESMTKVISEVPPLMRDALSSPGFYTIWGTE